MKAFYVYEHWRPDLDLPFYVGKGSGNRSNPKIKRNSHHENVVTKLSAMGMCVEIRMVAFGLSEDDALALEIERISFWRARGVELANKTAGGDGLKGPTEETLQKMRDAAKKRWSDPMERLRHGKITRRAMDQADVKQKLSSAQLGKRASLETRAKMSKARMGHAVSDETRAKISAAHIGNSYGAKTRGIPRPKMSDDTKANMRNSQRARRLREKGAV